MLRLPWDIVQPGHFELDLVHHCGLTASGEYAYTLVRAYLGYERFDSAAQVLALNALYDKLWLYYNLFQPVMHLVEKETVCKDGQPTRVRRRHDQATTPFDRLCQTNAILPEHRAQLDTLRDSINPRRLREAIYDAIAHILRLPCAASGVSEDVHQTLTCHSHTGGDDLPNLAFNRTQILD